MLHSFFDGTHLELHIKPHQTGLMDRKLYLPHDELERYECDEVLGGWEMPFSRSVSMWLVGSNRREGALLEPTLHIAETIQNPAEETLKLLSYKPDRLRHAAFLNAEAIAIIFEKQMGIEICLSSDLLCTPRSAPHLPIPQSEPPEPSPKSLLVQIMSDID
ncbi:hypothetical protein GALMADRAFT_154496 [Galerina marginata CBS 339.88]|uniref:Uncharacterized protein n=1 Tax=Galerina marginata (strain CBS 339.88) TaxID=685588 RepID=A0A067THM4_GALM3|nr:hypothetical protein GALMADRAFT_154496 [Galerina marginata CBS 339.88]